MAKSDEGKKDSYYQKVKQENEELKDKYGWLESESFLLDGSADMRNVYMFLKKNPESAKFIYKKYKPLQATIKEICDPENPLYLDGVAKALEGIVQVEDSKEDIQKLKQEIARNTEEINKIDNELEEKSKELDETERRLNEANKELENYERNRANVRSDNGFELVMKAFNDAASMLNDMDAKWKESFKTDMSGMRLTKQELEHMLLIRDNLQEVRNRIESEDFLSAENLDAYHREQMEKLRKEKEDVENQIIAVQAMNPKKAINRAIDSLNQAIKGLGKGDPMPDGGASFYKTGLNFINGYLDESADALSKLASQLENVDRRSK